MRRCIGQNHFIVDGRWGSLSFHKNQEQLGGAMIGLSISFCIKDVCRGKVRLDDVEQIIAGTNAKSPEDWDALVEQYQEVYWRRFPEEVNAVLGYLLDNDKIVQPRKESDDVFAPNIANGYWVKSEANIVWDSRL